MKILNICADDWSNLMHGHTRALRRAGGDVQEAKLSPHKFNYSTETPVVKPTEMVRLIKNADVVNIYHSSKSIANLITATGVKGRFVCTHTGSDYRSNPDGVKNTFQQIGVKKYLTDQCEFLLIEPSLEYVACAVDTEYMAQFANPYGFIEQYGSKFVVGHFPSKADVKGSEAILRMLAPFYDKFQLNYSDEKVGHREQLRRMNNCHIYVELFQNELHGKPYGCFGVTAFEAAALGKIVVTQNINPAAYEKAYGACPFVIANTAEDFAKAFETFKGYGTIKLESHRQYTQRLLHQNHGLEATGNRLKRILSEL